MSIRTVTSRHVVQVGNKAHRNGPEFGNNTAWDWTGTPRELTCTVVPARGTVRDMLMMRGADKPHTLYFSSDPQLREDDRVKWTLTGEIMRVMIPAFNAHGQSRLWIVGCNMLGIDNPESNTITDE